MFMSSRELSPSSRLYPKNKPKPNPTCVLQLLATVLSQSAKAKEHLLEQSKSMDQPVGKRVAPAEGHRSLFQVFHSRMWAQSRRLLCPQKE